MSYQMKYVYMQVRQGCVASPTLFNLYTAKIFRHIINMKDVKWEAKITNVQS